MAFGKRFPVAHPRAQDDGATAAPLPRRAGVAGTAMLGLLLGFGGVTAGTTFVQASERSGLLGFFEDLFRPPAPVAEAPQRAPKRYAALPDARRVSGIRTRNYSPRQQGIDLAAALRRRARGSVAAAAVPPVWNGNGPRTVCVRTCDGYLFPLGALRAKKDMPVHQAACAAACPNAPTALFTLPDAHAELQQAVSLSGQPYLASAFANVYRQRRVQNCACQPPGVAARPLSVTRDSTIRVGDVVANAESADVVTNLSAGAVQLADYRSARGLTRRARREIERQVGAAQREAEQAAFRRALRQADHKSDRVRVAEAGFLRIRMTDAGQGFDALGHQSDSGRGFTPVRQIALPLYER